MSMSRQKYLPYFMWLFPLLFFGYQFILRLWPGLLMNQTMEQFSIDASGFGLLAAFYYYGYSGMQIPVAILLDKYSPRFVISGFALLCALATWMFTYSDNFYVALLSRFLIGAGSAVGFLGVSKIVSQWFSKDQYARMIGLSFSFGLLGAIYGGKPVNMLIEQYSWQNVALGLAAVSLAIGAACYLLLRPGQEVRQEDSKPLTMRGLAELFSSPIIWGLGLSGMLMVGALEGFADVWGVQYLMKAYSIAKGDAAGLMSFVFIGMLFGGPLLALCSKKFGNYRVLAACGGLLSLAFLGLFNITHYSWLLMACLFFVIGMICCYQVIVFAAGAELVSSQNLGVTIAFLNCVNMLGGSFFHTVIGKLMDFFWQGALSADGIRVYDLVAYKYALGVIPGCSVVGATLVCLMGIKLKGLSKLADAQGY